MATDIYALGAVLYEMLSGRPPFRAETPVETLRQVLAAEPLPPSRLNAGVPRDLETICLKCLEKVPGRRYATARELADDLDNYLNCRPIRARPVGKPERAWRWLRRHPAAAVAILSLALVVITTVLGVAWHLADLEHTIGALTHKLQAEAQINQERTEEALYISDLQTAAHFWHQGEPALAREILDRHRPQPGQADRREFAWHLLNGCCQDGITPDGKTLISAGSDMLLKLWDVDTGVLRSSWAGHTGRVAGLALSADARTLASGGQDGVVRLWDMASGKARLLPRSGPVLALAFARAGPMLAVGESSGAVTLWDTATGQKKAVWKNQETPVHALLFPPDRRTLLTGGADRDLLVYDLPRKRFTHNWWGPLGVILDLACNPEGQVLVGRSEGSLRLWDLASGAARRVGEQPPLPVAAVAFTPDGKALATCGRDETIRFRSYLLRSLLGVQTNHDGSAVIHTADGVQLWDRSSGRWRSSLADEKTVAPPSILAQAADATIAVGMMDGTVWFWDGASGKRLGTLQVGNQAQRLVAQANLVRKGIPVCLEFRDGIKSLAFSPDSRHLAALTENGTLLLWDKTSNAKRALPGSYADASVLTFSPDGSILAVSLKDKVQIWDWQKLGQRSVLSGAKGALTSLAFSADGHWLAAGGDDWLVHRWALPAGKYLTPLAGHTNRISALAFSPDGRNLASAAHDGTTRLWHQPTGKELLTLDHGSTAHCLAFSPDGTTLAVGGAGGVARGDLFLWTIQPARAKLPPPE